VKVYAAVKHTSLIGQDVNYRDECFIASKKELLVEKVFDENKKEKKIETLEVGYDVKKN